jgi:hypothetical protein
MEETAVMEETVVMEETFEAKAYSRFAKRR